MEKKWISCTHFLFIENKEYKNIENNHTRVTHILFSIKRVNIWKERLYIDKRYSQPIEYIEREVYMSKESK